MYFWGSSRAMCVCGQNMELSILVKQLQFEHGCKTKQLLGQSLADTFKQFRFAVQFTGKCLNMKIHSFEKLLGMQKA